MVGGAVLNQEYADMIKADIYGKDAMDCVKFCKNYYVG
jgi:5-methyltetrahydrofolate--homocysteine methyltransferase